jgi:hypothetical protein
MLSRYPTNLLSLDICKYRVWYQHCDDLHGGGFFTFSLHLWHLVIDIVYSYVDRSDSQQDKVVQQSPRSEQPYHLVMIGCPVGAIRSKPFN